MVCRYSCVETRALPGSSQVAILIAVTLVNYCYHDKALILPEFLFMKTVREDEITHCCSVRELKITFAWTCIPGCKESVFNVLFLVFDFPGDFGWGGVLVGLGIQSLRLGFNTYLTEIYLRIQSFGLDF